MRIEYLTGTDRCLVKPGEYHVTVVIRRQLNKLRVN